MRRSLPTVGQLIEAVIRHGVELDRHQMTIWPECHCHLCEAVKKRALRKGNRRVARAYKMYLVNAQPVVRDSSHDQIELSAAAD